MTASAGAGDSAPVALGAVTATGGPAPSARGNSSADESVLRSGAVDLLEVSSGTSVRSEGDDRSMQAAAGACHDTNATMVPWKYSSAKSWHLYTSPAPPDCLGKLGCRRKGIPPPEDPLLRTRSR